MAAEIDWAALEHAYGTASNVPRLLRALVSDLPHERYRAFVDLYTHLCHQCTVYSATAAAIPFLVETTLDAAYPSRARLLRFLGDACHGNGPDLGAVRRALVDESPRLLSLFQDPDEHIRAHALWVLAAPEFRAVADHVARLATADPAPEVRAMAWLCLGAQEAAKPPEPHEEDDTAVQLASALARIDSTTEADAKELGSQIAVLLKDGKSIRRLLMWTGRYTDEHPLVRCAPLLRASDPDDLWARNGLGDVLCDALARETDDSPATWPYWMLLDAVFPRRAAPRTDDPPIDVATLTTAQRRVLTAIVQSEAPWQSGDVSGALKSCGITTTKFFAEEIRDELFEVLGVTPLKRALIGLPRWSGGAEEAAVEAGREEWLDTPFVFLSGPAHQIAEALPDPGDFPPEVIADAEKIAEPLYQELTWESHPQSLLSWTFLPRSTREEAVSAFTARGYAVVAPDPADETGEAYLDRQDARGLQDGVAYADIPADVKTSLEAFVEIFDEHGWSDVRSQYELSLAMGGAGMKVRTLASGQRRGDTCEALAAFHVEPADTDDGVTAYVQLTVTSDDDDRRIRIDLVPGTDHRELFTAVAALDLSLPPVEVVRSLPSG